MQSLDIWTLAGQMIPCNTSVKPYAVASSLEAVNYANCLEVNRLEQKLPKQWPLRKVFLASRWGSFPGAHREPLRSLALVALQHTFIGSCVGSEA